jgi:hypothetical protein
LKNYTEADIIYANVIEQKPTLPLGYLTRARANSLIDTTSELGLAKPYYEKFIELAATSSDAAKYKNDLIEAYSYLGYFYYIKKDDETYKSIWKENFKITWGKVLELDPENLQAKEALKNIK